MAFPYLVQPKGQNLPLAIRANLMGAILRWVISCAIVLLLLLPPLLLFVNSGVPWYFALLLLLIAAILIVLMIRHSESFNNVALSMVALAIVAAVAVALSQIYAGTPPIVGAGGEALPKSIAVMEKVALGGSEQWITIRGDDVEKPVLLYLGIGGPGAGGFPASAMTLAPLEKHFVVVNWDQPGTGKSYGAVPISSLTVERIVSDARELTELLRQRFDEEKIYVLGLSWGTIVGIQLVRDSPELFYAFVGNGQMVNTTENDRMGFELALRITEDHGDAALVRRLRANGPPPYSGEGMAMKYALYNNVLFRHMDSVTLDLILLLVPQFSREYGLVDRVNFARGLLDSFPVLYPQLRDLDFEKDASQLEVPVFFLVGRQDVNAMASLVERYHARLSAPIKELIWLEGGHGASPEQTEAAFVDRVLPQTLPVHMDAK